MCGISCLIYKTCENACDLHSIFEKTQTNIKRRGPDSFHTRTYKINDYTIKITASVLWLQGENITTQPIETEHSVFAYNGDIFNTNGNQESERLCSGDTRMFLNILESDGDLVEKLERVHGPYSFIYLDKKNAKLYFTRDFYGRRSLLLGKSKQTIVVSSVVVKNPHEFIELPPIGIFCMDLTNAKISVLPWKIKNLNFEQKVEAVENCLGDELLISNKYEISSRFGCFKEPNANELDIFDDIKKFDTFQSLQYLMTNPNWNARVNKLKNILKEAVRIRIKAQPGLCSECLHNQQDSELLEKQNESETKNSMNIICNHAKVCILFSGGLDCSILALLADAYLESDESIDLMNVAFSGPHGYRTPDRISGLETLEELKQLRPNRVWNFLEINVTQEELDKERDSHIKHLIFPLNTILDDSLGCALWFASRGSVDGYVSPCRVVLVGMGADELFGGYTRHRAALKKSGLSALYDSMQQDWMNIAHRNLARDDRIVSDHGRQLRTPYLNENLVEYILSLNVWEKTYPSDKLAAGLGEKILLRTLAYDLGLRGAACLKKRALQFGSRIADKKEKAHEISPRL